MLTKLWNWLKGLFSPKVTIQLQRYKAPRRDGEEWTPTEEQYIQDHADSTTDRELGKMLGRTVQAVRQKRYYLKNGRDWRKDQ